AVLNSFFWDYGRNPNTGSPVVNSFPWINNTTPIQHIFRAAGAADTYHVRLRAILPYHQGDASEVVGDLVSQDLTVYVSGTPACFSATSGPLYTAIPVDASCSGAVGQLEYQWNWGDGTQTGWSTNLQTSSHNYDHSGTKTITLSIRNANGEGHVATLPQTVSVTAPPAPIVNAHADGYVETQPVKSKQTCEYAADISNGEWPMSITWWRGASQVGSDQWLSYYIPPPAAGNPFWLRAVVTDYLGRQALDSVQVTISSSGQTCIL
ncbi:MAG TPA: PKD domain-containing protein, partial [Gemmatimonadales bacterium]|nr:PKD domain-containing protein [Gemmatimonadales bacterium]